jgi:ATP-binding cassette, subfamily F, member 3
VKLILGVLTPTGGDIIRSNVRVALVNQHHADQLDMSLTPVEYMIEEFPCPSSGISSYDHTLKLRSHLASCGVPGGNKEGTIPDLQNVPIAALSGGQRSRVALAAVSFLRPHVLVLDEPTNNLDLESVGALAESVKKFDGAVIVVSHDQYFVNEVANEAWVVAKGKVSRVESFEAYRLKELAKLNKTNV